LVCGFFRRSPCGRNEYEVIPPPSEVKTASPQSEPLHFLENGAIAQLGERFNGIEEVVGSIPSGSTNLINKFSILSN
jgi:hypothetical protein